MPPVESVFHAGSEHVVHTGGAAEPPFDSDPLGYYEEYSGGTCEPVRGGGEAQGWVDLLKKAIMVVLVIILLAVGAYLLAGGGRPGAGHHGAGHHSAGRQSAGPGAAPA